MGAGQGLAQGVLERRESGVGILPQVDAGDGQIVRLDRSEVARCLGIDELAEGVRPAGDGSVVRVVGRQLEEPADWRAALVELPGRVEEARAVAGGRGAAGV